MQARRRHLRRAYIDDGYIDRFFNWASSEEEQLEQEEQEEQARAQDDSDRARQLSDGYVCAYDDDLIVCRRPLPPQGLQEQNIVNDLTTDTNSPPAPPPPPDAVRGALTGSAGSSVLDSRFSEFDDVLDILPGIDNGGDNVLDVRDETSYNADFKVDGILGLSTSAADPESTTAAESDAASAAKTDCRDASASPSQVHLDFNERFQRCVEQVLEFSARTPVSTKLVVNEELAAVARDFLYLAKLHARLIISEMHLPVEEKTLRPMNDLVGGIAGGDKYISQNILFKVATTGVGALYSSNEAAAKVAGHELKGLVCYFNVVFNRRADAPVNSGNLSIPLAAVIDYRGVRCVAETLVPITDTSLVCGSADAGRTMRGLDTVDATLPDVARLLLEATAALNTKVHRCTTFTAPCSQVIMAGPADMEVHVTESDRRTYILDFARVMPPMAPLLAGVTRHRSSHLYELLRPEFVSQYQGGLQSGAKIPLSSDAFSSFGSPKDRFDENSAVVEATRRMLDVMVPRAARKLILQVERTWRDFSAGRRTVRDLVTGRTSTDIRLRSRLPTLIEFVCDECLELCRLLHREGVNLRLLGLVYMCIELNIGECIPANVPEEFLRLASDLLMTEMVARVSKVLHRRAARNTQRTGPRTVLEEPLLRSSVRLCNLLFGSATNGAVTQFWTSRIAAELSNKFFAITWSEPWRRIAFVNTKPPGILRRNRVLGAIPQIPDNELLLHVRTRMFALPMSLHGQIKSLEGLAIASVYFRFEAMAGLHVAPHIRAEIIRSPHSFFVQPAPFASGDVGRLKLRVKSLNVVEHAMGYISKINACSELRRGRIEVAERLFRQAYIQLESALERNPLSKVSLRNMAQVLEGLAEIERRKLPEGGENSDLISEILDSMELLYERALAVDPSDGHTLVQLAAFFEFWRHDFVKARLFYERTVAEDPDQVPAILGLERLHDLQQVRSVMDGL